MTSTNGFNHNYDGTTTTSTYPAYFSSYSGNQGTFFSNYYLGLTAGTQLQTQQNGTIVFDQAVTLASITDGTSNTFLYGEKAHGYFAVWDATYQYCDTVWISPLYFDTLFTTFYPPNVPTSSSPGLTASGVSYYFATDATSYHSGVAYSAFCDGSVRFIKNSINCWGYAPGGTETPSYGDTVPNGITLNSSTLIATVNTGCQFGVYQALDPRVGAVSAQFGFVLSVPSGCLLGDEPCDRSYVAGHHCRTRCDIGVTRVICFSLSPCSACGERARWKVSGQRGQRDRLVSPSPRRRFP